MTSLRKLTPLFRLLFTSLVLSIALLLLYRGGSSPTNAQQPQTPPQERQFENTIPKHVPLDVKLTKEKEKNWKDLKNENWAKDFELEITNTGEKPIYTFYLLIFFDVPTDFETELIAPIYYGRPEISDPRSKPTVDDIPIKPGESRTFKIHPNILLSWEKGQREKGWRLPTKVRIKIESLTFGDGTGLMFNQAVPYPRSPQASKLNGVTSQPTRRGKEAVKWRPAVIGRGWTQISETRFTGGSSAGKFLSAHSESMAPRTTAQPYDSCDTACDPRIANFRVTCYGCAPQDDPLDDPSGTCTTLSSRSFACTVPETGVTYICTVEDPVICMSEPAPTPIPTPTPSPTPPPECFSCSSDAQCGCGHCNLNYGICYGNANVGGCSEHFIDDCPYNVGYLPVDSNTHTLVCSCSHDWGYGGGDGGGGSSKGCQFSDCSCDPNGNGWECNSQICVDLGGAGGICAEGLIDPILINVGGGDFKLTNAGNGVMFDFFDRGAAIQMSWTDGQSNDAWLVLDWNHNGRIDNGKEMFSNLTPERLPTDSPIGFKALAMFDGPEFGGNSDGVIDQRDRIFRQLRLWQDVNHNGISEPAELHTLPELGLESISLDYRESRRTDRWGNLFRYRVKVYGANHRDLGRWAYDVILQWAKPLRTAPSIALNPLRDADLLNGEPFGSASSHRLGEVVSQRNGSFLRAIARTSAFREIEDSCHILFATQLSSINSPY